MDRRKWVQIGAAVLSTVALVAMMIGPADAGGGFNCDGCVDKGDIGADAVGTSEIDNASVTKADLHKSAGARLGSVRIEGSASGAGPDTIDSLTITVPAAGYLYVHASGSFYFDQDAANSESLTDFGYLALCTSPATLSAAACQDDGAVGGGGAHSVYYQDAEDAAASADNHTPFFSLTRVIAVGAGTKTLYLNGQSNSAGDTLSLWGDSRAAVVWTPFKLTVTS